MIGRIKGIITDSHNVSTSVFHGTMEYRNALYENIFSLKEQEFEEFVTTHYEADIKKNNLGPLQYMQEQATAFNVYQTLIEDLKKEKSLEECNYGLWFTDVSAFEKDGFSSKFDEDPNKDKAIKDLLLAANRFIGQTANEKASTLSVDQEWTELSTAKIKALFISSPKEISRTSILIAFYYYYNAIHECDKENGPWITFKEIFNDYQSGLNPMLEEAYYQPLSAKNLFDMLIIFSSYAYLNDVDANGS